MKKVLLIVLLVLVCIVGAAGYGGYRFLSFLISCNGCVYEYNGGTVVHGSGHAVTQSRPVTGFSAVHVAGSGSILVDRTGTESLSITADDNLLAAVHVGGEGRGAEPWNSQGQELSRQGSSLSDHRRQLARYRDRGLPARLRRTTSTATRCR